MSSRGKKAKGKGKGKESDYAAAAARSQKARAAALARPRVNGKFVADGERKTKPKKPTLTRNLGDRVFFSAANIRRMLEDFNSAKAYGRSGKGPLRISRDALIAMQEIPNVEAIGHIFLVASGRATLNKGATISLSDVETVSEILNARTH